MNKVRLFLENFIVYGLGGIISKSLPVIMVPIITRIMPDSSYYGISDLANTVIQFGTAVATMGMYDALYRMFFERDDDVFRKKICTTAFLFTVFCSIVTAVIMVLFRNTIASFFLGDSSLEYIVSISAMATLVNGPYNIVSAPTRMQNKRKLYLIVNTIGPLISYAIAIVMLMKGYYIIALPLAGVISGGVIGTTYLFLNKKWFSICLFDKKVLKELLVIGIPLLPGFLIYWIFNSCDKVMIANIMGAGAAGIYSVGSKLGHCSQLIYIAFSGGWQFFAFSTMREADQVQSNSRIFEYLGVISFVVTAYVSAWSFPLFSVLFTEEYWSGYIVAPYLFLAPLMQMIFQVASNQFLIIKKTWPCTLILLVGATLNIIVNYVLIPVLGIEGAAIATLLGYVVSDIVCVFVLVKMKLMVISMRFMLSCIFLIIFFIVWRVLILNSIFWGTLGALILNGIVVMLYKKDIIYFVRSLRKNS